MSKKSILIIMDGWAEAKQENASAINSANTPYIDSLHNNSEVAYTRLKTSGEVVGLPEGQMGNSEVGHLNIGAGRIVNQDIVRINKAIESNEIESNPTLQQAFTYAEENDKAVHFLGLVSDGGVHSSTKHLMKLTEMVEKTNINRSYVHVLTDGRDTDPKSGIRYVKELQDYLSPQKTRIASVCGRYYTMDRDKRWERIKLGYDLMVNGRGKPVKDAVKGIKNSYENGITDEFIKPIVIFDEENQPTGTIEEGDVVICFNFRTDRLREITTVLTQQDMPEHKMQTLDLHYVTMTRYDERFKNIHVIFSKPDLKNTMGEVIANNNKQQLRIAETEKYAHVTFFFSGGREVQFENEDRILVPSPKVPTYDLQPSMSAHEVRDKVIEALNKNTYDFVCLNFANPDMVGHTGVFKAIVEAVETVDSCVKDVAEAAINNDYAVFITADHGNADHALNEDGSPNTAHSTNPVPLFVLNTNIKQLKNEGKLADIIPTMLTVMDIPVPKDMTGNILIES
ncbi:MAG: 2,3-bisphosphoglycerate-independent phosphoglycerate mutase [Bacteroidales bacterium]|nr:2,3-bisphosphoglycerate-independent phosphoglycerate mutase [Bacteroidales bacterium]MCF8327013.1 2,3-bisphosphoglycerate-independent phosphoglycerate mutase [Bacteroidales bacterium]